MDTALVFVLSCLVGNTHRNHLGIHENINRQFKNPTVPKLGDFPGPSKAGVLCDMVQGPQGGRKESTVGGFSSP